MNIRVKGEMFGRAATHLAEVRDHALIAALCLCEAGYDIPDEFADFLEDAEAFAAEMIRAADAFAHDPDRHGHTPKGCPVVRLSVFFKRRWRGSGCCGCVRSVFFFRAGKRRSVRNSRDIENRGVWGAISGAKASHIKRELAETCGASVVTASVSKTGALHFRAANRVRTEFDAGDQIAI